MNFKKLLIIGISTGLLAGALLFFSTHKPTINADTFIVGVSADFPPFTFIQENKIVGFEIDLVQEIGNRLHKKLEMKNMPFETLVPSLQLGTIHAIAAGLTATEQRAQHVLFTTPYIENNPLVIVSLKAAPAQSLKDLNNKYVIVNGGYTADLYISKIPGPKIIRLKTVAEAFSALKSGRASAFVTAQNTVNPYFKQYAKQDFYITRIPNTEESTSLAIAQKYPQLHQQIQATLNTMKNDGFIQKLKTHWDL